ncbi:MAG: DUF1211 domain-containing protein [Cyclobacteriaceae bacterium]|nr:DUF1211 domain-containing protein [Cyclobacteriaceae bacterium]
MNNHTFSKTRVEAFSDGVFAIIITLLVLEIKVPHIENHNSVPDLLKSLWGLTPKLVSWVISFLIVSVIWVNHHRVLETIKAVDNPLLWLNANLLLWCSFIPFPTALMGDYVHNPLAVFFFGMVMAFAALGFTFIRMYLQKHPELLQVPAVPGLHKRQVTRSFLFGPALYWVGALLAWVSPAISLVIYFLIPVYFIFPTPARKTPVAA